MDRGPRWRWRTVLVVLATGLILLGVASMLVRGRSAEVLYARWMFHNGPTGLFGLWVGWLVLRTHPGNPLGRLLLLLGSLAAAHLATIALADARLVAAGAGEEAIVTLAPAAYPLPATLPLWVSTWLWVPAAVLFVTLLLAWFPDGRPPSPGFRWIGPAAVVGAGLIGTAYGIVSWPTSAVPMTLNEQPTSTPLTRGLVVAGGVLVLAAAAGTIGTLVVRWRTASGERRQQLRSVIISGAVMAVTMTVLWPWQALWIPVGLTSMLAFLVTYGMAIARYRLHDLGVVLNRAVVATVLAAMVTLAYVVIVVGVGRLVDRSVEQRLLPLVAVGVVAVLFEPARRRVRRAVDRLLYGRDGDAAAVLSDLSGRLRRASSEEDLLGQVLELLTRGTAALGTELVAAGGAEGRVIARHGTSDDAPLLSTPVLHHGRPLGELRLRGRSRADLAPDAERLLEDVAGTLGVLVANRQLRDELQLQVEQLRRSRQRLVHVHDEARRELERDLHDGAQARLVALRMRLGLAMELAGDVGADGADGLLVELRRLGEDLEDALRDLRDLSRGLHPPALDGTGVVEALRVAVVSMPVTVTVTGPALRRYPPAVESAVYFSCLEAVQNALKHGAGQAHVTVGHLEGTVELTVVDDGPGFDPMAATTGTGLVGLRDRLAALGGTVTITSEPGHGTRVRGQVPVEVPTPPREPAADPGVRPVPSSRQAERSAR
jgi:two-component system, NarL family, sensor kinase